VQAAPRIVRRNISSRLPIAVSQGLWPDFRADLPRIQRDGSERSVAREGALGRCFALLSFQRRRPSRTLYERSTTWPRGVSDPSAKIASISKSLWRASPGFGRERPLEKKSERAFVDFEPSFPFKGTCVGAPGEPKNGAATAALDRARRRRRRGAFG